MASYWHTGFIWFIFIYLFIYLFIYFVCLFVLFPVLWFASVCLDSDCPESSMQGKIANIWVFASLETWILRRILEFDMLEIRGQLVDWDFNGGSLGPACVLDSVEEIHFEDVDTVVFLGALPLRLYSDHQQLVNPPMPVGLVQLQGCKDTRVSDFILNLWFDGTVNCRKKDPNWPLQHLHNGVGNLKQVCQRTVGDWGCFHWSLTCFASVLIDLFSMVIGSREST